ncbi:DUF3667 domain-containing protein [bacterium BD-1]|nr:DUF3667 domain-containing protein [Ottowia caeni]
MTQAPDPAPPERLTMAAFWRDFGDEVFSLDRGLPWTFLRMFRGPGALVRDYVVVRDRRIVRPLRFFLVGFALLALVFSLAGGVESARAGFYAGFDGQAPGVAAAIWWLLSQVQLLLVLVVLPAGAMALDRVYRGHGPSFAEMWVLCLFVAGQAMAVAALLFALDEWSHVPGMGPLLLLQAPAWFLATAIGYFPGASWPRRTLRAAAALALAAVLCFLFLVALVSCTATLRGLLA